MVYANCNKTEISMKVIFDIKRTQYMDLTVSPRYNVATNTPCPSCKFHKNCFDFK